MIKRQKHKGTPTPERRIAPPCKERGVLLRCPLNGNLCMTDCAWYAGDSSGNPACAIAVLAQQSARQANELYAMVDIMQPESEEGESGKGGEAGAPQQSERGRNPAMQGIDGRSQ